MSRTVNWIRLLAVGLVLYMGAFSAQAADTKQKKNTKKHVLIIDKDDREEGRLFADRWMHRGYLGVGLTDLSKQLRAHFGVPQSKGVMIDQIEDNSPAAKAGVKVGDILVEVDGESIDSSWKAVRIVGKKKKDHQAKLTLYRTGKKLQLTAAIQEREKPQIKVGRFIKSLPHGGVRMELDTEAFMEPYHETLEHLDEYLKDLDVEGLNKLHNLEGKIEERLKEVEKKLRKLEEKLQGKTKGNRSEQPST